MTRSTGLDAPTPRDPQRPTIAGRTVRGKQVRYSKALAEKICLRLAGGASLRTIARDPEMPPRSTLRAWLEQDHDGLFAQCPRPRPERDLRTLYTEGRAE